MRRHAKAATPTSSQVRLKKFFTHSTCPRHFAKSSDEPWSVAYQVAAFGCDEALDLEHDPDLDPLLHYPRLQLRHRHRTRKASTSTQPQSAGGFRSCFPRSPRPARTVRDGRPLASEKRASEFAARVGRACSKEMERRVEVYKTLDRDTLQLLKFGFPNFTKGELMLLIYT